MIVFCVIIIVLAVIVAAVFAAVGYEGFKTVCVPKPKEPPKDALRIEREKWRKANNDYLYSLNPEDLSIVTPDSVTLRAWFAPAEKMSKRFVICVHGHRCNGPDECSHILRFFRNTLGYNYLLPDLRAHGRSEGKYITFAGRDHKDILLWVDYLVNRFGEDIEIILYGISMGAATVMLANCANPPEQVKLVIEDCGFTNGFEEVKLVARDFVKGKKILDIPMRATNIYCRLLAKFDLIRESDPLGRMKNAKNPVLFIHGDKDALVPVSMCHRLYEACPVKKDIFIAEGSLHAFSYYDKKEEYEKKIVNFLEQTIGVEADTL